MASQAAYRHPVLQAICLECLPNFIMKCLLQPAYQPAPSIEMETVLLPEGLYQ